MEWSCTKSSFPTNLSGYDTMTERSSITMQARSATLQKSLDGEASGDQRSLLWRDVDPFPVVLHRMLGDVENEGNAHIISWNDDGMSFTIHKPKEFAATILTRYFRNQTRYKSFQRQLNLYRFQRISTAKERTAYAHKSFVRDSPHLCHLVRRTRKQPSLPQRPNLPIENIPFVPMMLPVELTLTHSATTYLRNNHSLPGKPHVAMQGPRTCVRSGAELAFLSPASLEPIGMLPCPSPKWASDFSTNARERSESDLSLRALLATLRPAIVGASLDNAWDDLSMGSIDYDDLSPSSSFIPATHDDNPSCTYWSVDGEIFP